MQLLQFIQVFKFNILGDSRCIEFGTTVFEESKGGRDPLNEAFTQPDDIKLED